jgi:hypothetical protein
LIHAGTTVTPVRSASHAAPARNGKGVPSGLLRPPSGKINNDQPVASNEAGSSAERRSMRNRSIGSAAANSADRRLRQRVAK